MEVSTGEPSGRWKPWVKWAGLALLVLAGVWAARISQQHAGVILAWAAAVLVLMSRFRLTGQRFSLLIDGHAVVLSLYTDISRRTWIEWKSGAASARTCIREAYCTGWTDVAIELHGKRYGLRILVKPFGDGYMLSNAGQGFDMIVVRHTCAF